MFWALAIRVCRVLLFKTSLCMALLQEDQEHRYSSLLSVERFSESERVPKDELTSESSQRG